jgi:hypothetical protein
MHALVRFAHVAAANTFRTCQLHAPAAEALGYSLSRYRSLRCVMICPSSELKA